MEIKIDSKKLSAVIEEEVNDLINTQFCVTCASVVGELSSRSGHTIQIQLKVTVDDDELIEVGNDICIEVE